MAKPGLGRLFLYNIFEQEPSLVEHYDAAFLSAALRQLRRGGLLVVNVPASMLLYSDYDRVQGHVRSYTLGGLAKLFDRCEVETEAVQAWAFLMVPFLLARRVLLHGAKIETAEAIL